MASLGGRRDATEALHTLQTTSTFVGSTQNKIKVVVRVRPFVEEDPERDQSNIRIRESTNEIE